MIHRTLVKVFALYAPFVMTTDAANLDGQVHPIFGRLSRAAWLRWA